MLEERQQAPKEIKHVNIYNEGDLSYWCENFKVSEDALKAAVHEVGTEARDVAVALRAITGSQTAPQ